MFLYDSSMLLCTYKEFLFYFTLGHVSSYEGSSFGAYEHFAYNLCSFYTGPICIYHCGPLFCISTYSLSNLFDIILFYIYLFIYITSNKSLVSVHINLPFRHNISYVGYMFNFFFLTGHQTGGGFTAPFVSLDTKIVKCFY